MSQPFIGEIRLYSGNFAPAGWAFCAGQLVPISEYEALFALIGTTYGGDGQTTFALPDLRGRAPVHQGSGVVIGQSAGSETVTLVTNNLPAHTHAQTASNSQGSSSTATGNVVAVPLVGATKAKAFHTAGDTPLAATPLSPIGGNQPHENMQPYLAVSFIISLFGIFPSRA